MWMGFYSKNKLRKERGKMENENLNEVTTNSFIENSFTLEDGNVNLDVNRLTTNCISSKNNKFGLDSEGNLVVNSISSRTSLVSSVIDEIYPVGCVYISMTDVNPSSLFGGVWEQIKDKFLLGSGDTYALGETGGEASHTLTTSELPSHSHKPINWDGFFSYKTGLPSRYKVATTTASSGRYTFVGAANAKDADASGIGYSGGTTSVGNNTSHNNMPPYLVVYMWKRVA